MRYLYLFWALFSFAHAVAQTQYVVVHSEGTNVYKRPNYNSVIITKLSFKSLLEVHEINSKWSKIYNDNQWGYVPTWLIKKNIARENSFDGLSHRHWEPINKKHNNSEKVNTKVLTNKTENLPLIEIESPNTEASKDSMSVNVLGMFVNHNQIVNEEKSLEIHLKFDIFNAKFEKCEAIALFFYDNGEPIKDINGKYCNSDGQVSSWHSFSPRYARSRYNDFRITIPNVELHTNNQSDINFIVVFRTKDQNIGMSWRYRFVISD